jgi:hypothetical protein
MFQLAKIAKGTRDRFTLPQVLDDRSTWRDQAGVRLKLHNATVASRLCWLVGTLFNKFGFFLDRPRTMGDYLISEGQCCGGLRTLGHHQP